MRLPLDQFARICREEEIAGFLNLRKLLPSDIEAAKALREENAFVQSPEFLQLNAPSSPEFARKVRAHLVAHRLEWNAENLLAAATYVLHAEAKEAV